MCSSLSELGSVHHNPPIEVIVETDDNWLVQEAARIQQLYVTQEPDAEITVYFGKEGVELRKTNKPHQNGFRVDFSTIDRRTGAGNLSKKQPLPKAIGSCKTIIDATAGFSVDAARLTLMGFRVVAFEKSPILALMVRDAIRRTQEDASLFEALCNKLECVEADSAARLLTIPKPDVIYLDPMFPPKRKKSALPPGPIQLIQSLVGYDNIHETKALFQIALTRASSRVVVKRPNHAPTLGENPIVIHKGKLVRYEVYRPHF